LFGDAEKIKKHVDSILTEIQNSERAPGYDRIYVHGEKEWGNRAVSIKDGVPLDAATCTLLEGFAKDYNIPSLFN
jgi:L-2-hydroxycarboxylate dehydrogenase (NAD+)